MKKVILLALLMPYAAFGQIVENFESGSLNNWVQSTEGRWKADTTGSLAGRYSLHHVFDNPDAGTDRIGLPLNNIHPGEGLTRWSLLIRHGYDPSSSNNWSVFLMSDTDPSVLSPEGSTNGFAIGVNLTGSDDSLRLWKVRGNVLTTVLNCGINWQTGIGINDQVKINIERSPEGNWTASVFRSNVNLTGAITGTDSELFSISWFEVIYRYSSSRDRLLWLDEISVDGVFYEDNDAPSVTHCEASAMNIAEVILSEEPSEDFTETGNFSMNGGENHPVSVTMTTPLTCRIEFPVAFRNRSLNNLVINSLCDKAGNCNQNIAVQFTPVWAERGDVIISEIMAAPFPEVFLPGKEYIEITNRTGFSFNLKSWELMSGEETVLLPAAIIPSSGIIILCASEDTSFFKKYGRVAGLKQFPSLTDGGKIICLSDSSDNLIHGVEYSSGWYGNELKSNGGWSLEITDTHSPFFYKGNWSASESGKGGTPGSENSTSRDNPDMSFYGILNVFPTDSFNITVTFSEPVFELPAKIKYIYVGDNAIKQLYPADPLYREFTLRPESPLTGGEVYQLDISGDVKDFAGNSMQKRIADFGLPEPPAPGDILFNELLFNPLPGDPDYIELYNCSEKVIDASRLQIVSVNDDTGDTVQITPVSVEKRCIMPGSYYAITTDRERISDRYFSADPEFLFETGSLPSMSDDEGHLILYSRELNLIDEVHYNKEMHFSLLSDYEGVALEKVSPGNSSANAGSWHSASESSGWGTPGAPNSVFTEMPVTSDIVTLSSTRISPDNDGVDDILVIGFSLNGNSNIISAAIFDESGNYVKKIAANLLAGPEASVIWDGTADDCSPVKTGIYIVFISLYDDTGKTEKWKKICTVVRN
jgi:hypothetical protein